MSPFVPLLIKKNAKALVSLQFTYFGDEALYANKLSNSKQVAFSYIWVNFSTKNEETMFASAKF
jgi:hypothetical protein